MAMLSGGRDKLVHDGRRAQESGSRTAGRGGGTLFGARTNIRYVKRENYTQHMALRPLAVHPSRRTVPMRVTCVL
jgi:hypothetical protein